jgi:emfourin
LTRRSDEGDQLELERSGGFAGLTLRALVPFEELSQPQRAAVDDSLSSPPPRRPQPDRFQYQLRVGERRVVLEEDDFPAVLRPLLRRLSVPR